MAGPTTQIVRYDLALQFSEFNEIANRRGFIGFMALPPLDVMMESAKFDKQTKEALLGKVKSTLRAPDGTYDRGDFETEQDTYATDDHGVEEPMDDRKLKIYGDGLRLERVHRRRGVNRVLMAYENEVSAAVFNTTTWTGASLTTAVSTPWSTAASATPIADIDDAKEAVVSSSGMKANTLILSDFALTKLLRTAEIIDLVKYDGHNDTKSLGVEALKEVFRLEKILVADGVKNTADEGQDGSFDRLWDVTKAMVCITNDDDDLESPDPFIGRTIRWTEENPPLPGGDSVTPPLIIEDYREENRRGGVLRVRCDYQVKIFYPQAGHLLTAVTA